MKKGNSLLIACMLVGCFLSGCGDTLLVVRTPLEADQYLRNNIEELEFDSFEHMVSRDSGVTEKEFIELQRVIRENDQTRYIMIEEELFRFNIDGELLYYTIWTMDKQEQSLKLDTLTIAPQ
ncbi:hypothetical protein BTS2_1869 [Bacillus sp. TS-2]|nr:hypothetical protein BTS2_1869 [Bacillus sp. TS-2]